MHEVNDHLVRMVRKMRDRTENSLTECEVLMEEVIQVNLPEGRQGHAAPNESKLEPKKGQVAHEGDVESAGLGMN